ncbi:MAG: zinc carboxypeptidase, partial [Flavisolibacter sp.]
DLLDKNRIVYGTSKAANSKGFSYATGKDESFPIAKEDIIVSSLQPKSALVKVLFEPSPVLVDTMAYDITAWSLPYAYGVRTFATKDVMNVNPDLPYFPSRIASASGNKMEDAKAADAYGYVIPWSSINTVKLVTQLMQKGIRLRYNERAFEVSGQSFDRGAVLVLRTSNQYYPGLRDTVLKYANEYRVGVKPVYSGFVDKGFDFGSSKVHSIKPRKIALLTGEGVSPGAAGEIWFYFEQEINYPVTLINATDVSDISWNDYDVIIMPDGNYKFLNDKESTDRLKSWISGGGNLVALEGAVAQLSRFDWTIRSKKEDTTSPKDIYESLKKFEGREREYISSSLPGSIFKVDLDNTHPLAFGYPNYFYTLKTDDRVYEFIKEGGWNVGVLKKNKQVSGFVGSKLQNRLQDGLLFGVQELGRGDITYLADDILFRSFWENGKLMFANAVFLVGQ